MEVGRVVELFVRLVVNRVVVRIPHIVVFSMRFDQQSLHGRITRKLKRILRLTIMYLGI